MSRMLFAKVPVDADFYILDHMAEHIEYTKVNTLGLSGMCCNALRKSDGTFCWVPMDKEVHYDPPKE